MRDQHEITKYSLDTPRKDQNLTDGRVDIRIQIDIRAARKQYTLPQTQFAGV